jgi:putative membrane protein
MWMWDGMGAMVWWSWLFLVVLLAAVALLTTVLIRMSRGTGRPGEPRWDAPAAAAPSRARAILDERYARGEIDAGEYDERRRRLEGSVTGEAG